MVFIVTCFFHLTPTWDLSLLRYIELYSTQFHYCIGFYYVNIPQSSHLPINGLFLLLKLCYYKYCCYEHSWTHLSALGISLGMGCRLICIFNFLKNDKYFTKRLHEFTFWPVRYIMVIWFCFLKKHFIRITDFALICTDKLCLNDFRRLF